MKLIIILIVAALAVFDSAVADTFIVNNTADPGDGTCNLAGCTLREAIDAANANPGTDRIEFNIIGSGVHTITPASELPDITDSVTIDGYTQPGASENTLAIGNDALLEIELNGSNAGPTTPGLRITDASNCVIRGLIVNRFDGAGILISLGGLGENLIEGNFIGTDPSGTIARPNTLTGITILVPDNMIGGVTPGTRNLISGNGGSGIVDTYSATRNQIMGNYIGTDRTGTIALGNGTDGINPGLGGDTIGGTAQGAGNLISGNGGNGIATATSENVVQGNLIGTDATGTVALPNGMHGILLFGNTSTNNLVGGTGAAARNLISGNVFDGIRLDDGAAGNVVQGNLIGSEVTGTAALGNFQNGVVINDSPGNTIGGSVPGAGNVISGNGAYGVAVSLTAATDNVIQGNWIGTDVSGSAALGNRFTGVLLAANNTLLGGLSGAGNTIAFNQQGGVAVFGTVGGNNIFGNSVFANEGLGIDLLGGSEDSNGVTANDSPDSDVGPNGLQNYPMIDSIGVSGSDRTAEGSLISNFNTEYVLNFYSNGEADPSGYGEGETWLGSLTVQTDAQGQADFSFPLETSALGRFITATATDPAGNTSEFSMASELVPPLNRFLNISTRLKVQTNDNVLIGGFIITGNDPKQVIVRAIGPSLGGQGVAGPLGDPVLELHYQDGTVITNDDWRNDQEDEIIATGVPPTDNKESAIVATLTPGPYTAIVRGANGGTGSAWLRLTIWLRAALPSWPTSARAGLLKRPTTS